MGADISGMLTALTELKKMADAARLDMEEELAAVVTAAQREQMARIRADYADRMEELDEQIARYEKEVRAAVLEAGETATGGGLQAVFMRPRVTWDTKGLDALTAVHPWLARLRKEGEASVSIRASKEGAV